MFVGMTMRCVFSRYWCAAIWIFRLKGGHVRGSDNWAAQTFYDNLPAFYEKYKDTRKVIFYCQSSNGRGPRCAGWCDFCYNFQVERVIHLLKTHRYQDYLDSQEGHKSTAYVLEGGIKSWLAKYGDDEDLVDRDWFPSMYWNCPKI